jgi:hypothetical protein
MEEKIKQLIEEELARANEKFPPFHSAHEGWAVLLEEVEEVRQELDTVSDLMDCLWGYVKENLPENQSYKASQIKVGAIKLFQEAIQVAAMARKFEQFLERQGEAE